MGYIEAIGIHWPNVQCYSQGPEYTDLVWESGDPLPSKEVLDAWIANPTSLSRKITVLAFRNRFTSDEKVTIDMASIDNPATTQQQRLLAASIRVSNKDLDVASFVDLDRPDTRSGVIALEQYGIISAGRALEILDAPTTLIELPT